MLDRGGDRGGEAQSGLCRNPRAVRRPAGPQPGGEGRAGRCRRAGRSIRWSQLDPIYVTFNPSESDLAEIATGAGRRQGRGRDLARGRADTIRKGELTFLDNIVDKSTGTIAARVTIANPDFALLPGQYVRVRLHIRDEPDAFMAPQAALGSNQMGKFVYVVGEGDKAELRLLTLGPTDGELVSVIKGLSEGERVIVGNSAEDRPRLAGQAAAAGAEAKSLADAPRVNRSASSIGGRSGLRRTATISARIESAISSAEIAEISSPAGALIAASASSDTPSLTSSFLSVSALRREPTNAR